MAKKICVDAGHFGKYNQSTVNKKYYESVAMWELHTYLVAELKTYGFTVVTTRSKQETDLALEKRGAKAKGCDFFISLHSNASSTESSDFAVACCQIDDAKTNIDDISEALGRQLAKAVNDLMGAKGKWTIWERVGNYNKDYYGVLRSAKDVGAPAIILEHGFHTNKKNTAWLLESDNLKKLARVEAQIIADHFGVKKVSATKPTTTTKELYRVRKTWADAKSQLGAFASLASAKKLADKNPGYEVYNNAGKVVYTPKTATKKTVTEIAREVIKGKWGNGTARKEALTKAGFDYSAVQKEVNRLLG